MDKRFAGKLLLPILAVSLFLACGVTLAYMFRQSNTVQNEFTPAEVDCEVIEAFNGSQKTSITVKNTGNIAAYLRVRLVSYWVDGEGNIVARESEMPTVIPASGWLRDAANDTYYYTVPVEPEGFTGELLESPIVLRQDGLYRQVVEVFADAIQSLPAVAVENSWGVDVNDDGTITQINAGS